MDRNLIWAVGLLACIAGVGWLLAPRPEAPQVPVPASSPISRTEFATKELEVVTRYFRAVERGDYLAAYETVAPFGHYGDRYLVKAGWSYERCARALKRSQPPRFESVGIVWRPDGGLVVEVTFVERLPIEVKLVEVEGKWYLKEPPFLGVFGSETGGTCVDGLRLLRRS